ncbi:MAG: hypothetical protein K0U45_01025 [Alphaproteobacteria bacterium]|nr:hypothetical protein [Alphaproteobacteria bacterium]
MPKWKKLGRVFDTSHIPEWSKTHATKTTALLCGNYVRVFFSTRDENILSFPIYADYHIDNLTKMINMSQQPLMDLGKPGTFDDAGVVPSYACHVNNKIYLYYIGYNKTALTSFYVSIGLAISSDGGDNFTRAYEGPIIGRNKYNHYIVTGPNIIREDNDWKMWYSAGTSWLKVDNQYEPQYEIRYAESDNGIDWQYSDQTCIACNHPNEALGKSSVIKHNNTYHMWFSYRDSVDYRDGKGSYQIGYASSPDGKNWVRDDKNAGIAKSEQGWDSKMICYGNVIKIGQDYYMYYNGNGFGQNGFGLAVLESID